MTGTNWGSGKFLLCGLNALHVVHILPLPSCGPGQAVLQQKWTRTCMSFFHVTSRLCSLRCCDPVFWLSSYKVLDHWISPRSLLSHPLGTTSCFVLQNSTPLHTWGLGFHSTGPPACPRRDTILSAGIGAETGNQLGL